MTSYFLLLLNIHTEEEEEEEEMNFIETHDSYKKL